MIAALYKTLLNVIFIIAFTSVTSTRRMILKNKIHLELIAFYFTR